MRESPGSGGRPCRPVEQRLRRLGQLVDTMDLRTRAPGPGQLVDPMGPRARSRVTLESYSTPRAIGPERHTRESCYYPRAIGPRPEWPLRAGQTSCPGRPCRPSDPRQSRPGYLVDPRGLGSWPESPGRADRPRGPSDPGPSRLEQLVDPAGPWTQARVTRDSWSTPQALGAGPESPGTSG